MLSMLIRVKVKSNHKKTVETQGKTLKYDIREEVKVPFSISLALHTRTSQKLYKHQVDRNLRGNYSTQRMFTKSLSERYC